MCLSPKEEYEGGEFELYVGRKMFSFKMDCGDAIIFPSDCMHRVRRINSGSRKPSLCLQKCLSISLGILLPADAQKIVPSCQLLLLLILINILQVW